MAYLDAADTDSEAKAEIVSVRPFNGQDDE
jgi:hypothetical protein